MANLMTVLEFAFQDFVHFLGTLILVGVIGELACDFAGRLRGGNNCKCKIPSSED